MAGGGLTRLRVLSEAHKEWLDHYYKGENSLTKTAEAFGVSDTAVSEVRDSPAGQEYSVKLMGTTRASINMKVANIILTKIENGGMALPLDILVKVYAATLPKETPGNALEHLRSEADRLADEYNLPDHMRAQLIEFVLSGGKFSGVSAAPGSKLTA